MRAGGRDAQRFSTSGSVEVHLPGSLSLDTLRVNARSMFENVVPKLGEMLQHLARGGAPRVWADLKDAEYDWRAGKDSFAEAYRSLGTLRSCDWTRSPAAPTYVAAQPNFPLLLDHDFALPFLESYLRFDSPRLDDDLALADAAAAFQ